MKKRVFSRKAQCLVVLFLLSLAMGYSQQTLVSKVWENDGGTQFFFRKSKTVVDDNSYVYTIGETVNGYGNYDWYLEKYSPEGDTLFRRQFDGGVQLNDLAIDILVDNGTQEIYVVGAATRDTADSMDMCIVKYDYNGDFLWSEFYDVSGGNDIAADIEMHPDGYFFVAGTAKTSDMQDMALLCYDNTGSLLFSRLYDGYDLNDMGIRLYVNWDYVFVSGGSQRNATTWDFVVRKYEIDGDLVNTSSAIAGVGEIYDLQDMAVDINKNIYLTGSVKVTGEEDIVVAKLDSNLNVLWEETYAGNVTLGHDKGNSIRVDGGGNVYITGYVATAGQGKNMVLLKYSSTGTLLYDREHNNLDNLDDAGNSMQVVSNGNIYIAGYSGTPANGQDYLTACYTVGGDLKFITTYNSLTNQNDVATDIALDPTGGIVVTGQSGSGFTYQYITVKYDLYENPADVVLGNDDVPAYKANEVVICVDPLLVVNTDFVDDPTMRFAYIEDVLDNGLVTEIQEALELDVFANPHFRIIKMFDQKTTDEISVTRSGYHIAMPLFWSTFILRLPEIADEQGVISSLNAMDAFYYAELNNTFQLAGSNDSIFSTANGQSNLKPTITDSLAHINADSAWTYTVGDETIKIGVLDNGIWYTHEDMGNAVSGNLDSSKVIGGKNFDNASIQITNLSAPASFVHGTAVAGIMGALRDNVKGIAGISGGDPDSSTRGAMLVDMRVCCDSNNAGTFGYQTSLSQALFEGARSGNNPYNGLDIMNMSMAGAWGSPPNTLMKALAFARNSEVVLVAARGGVNDNNNPPLAIDSTEFFPACYPYPEMLLNVGASGRNGEALKDYAGNGSGAFQFSAGGRGMDFIAPGASENVKSLQKGGGYSGFGGTSSAAAHVSGVAALMLSSFENKTPLVFPTNLNMEDIEHILAYTAYNERLDTSNVYTFEEGWGKINAKRALEVIHSPDYKVLHFTAWLDSFDIVLDQDSINPRTTSGFDNFFVINFSPFANPIYPPNGWNGDTDPIDRYKFQAVINHGNYIAPGATILGHWIRNSFSDAWGLNNSVGTQFAVNGWPNVKFDSFNASSAQLSGYFYRNPNFNHWYPYDPANSLIRLSYTVHVYDTTGETGVEEILNTENLNLYPNPATDPLNVSFTLPESEFATLEITDLTGKVVYTAPSNQYAIGINLISLPLQDLASGTYILRMITERSTQARKFIKQ